MYRVRTSWHATTSGSVRFELSDQHIRLLSGACNGFCIARDRAKRMPGELARRHFKHIDPWLSHLLSNIAHKCEAAIP
jgi:hypothetical protein